MANDDLLLRIRAKVAEVRDIANLIAQREEELSELNRRKQSIEREELPQLFFEAGTDEHGIPPEGNYPAVTAKLEPYYKANISMEWPEEKRRAAFDWLDQNGHGDLIKTAVSVSLPREEREAAHDLIKELRAQGLPVEVKETVAWATLTAWLKEQIEKYRNVPPLEVIGGDFGSIVKLKKRKAQ